MINYATERRRRSAWYVVHARQHKEEQVARMLHERLDVGVYLPLVRQRGRGQVEASPFFPCYVFVRADLERTPLSAINTAPGVVKLVAFGDTPMQLADDIVDELRRRVDELNDTGGFADPRLFPGAAVRLRTGPLRGLEGAFVGPISPSLRVRVLIEFLGSLRETEVDASAVEPLSTTTPAPPRERRTRGGGRRVAARQPAR